MPTAALALIAPPTGPAPAPQAATPPNPVQRCLRLLDVLARDGVAFARRLYAARSRPPDQPDPARSRARINHLLYRALLAVRHAITLAARLDADPSYRGEPARPTRAPAAPSCRWSPPPEQARARRKPRPFEQVFAGRSIGQIIDHIRHDLGLPGRIGPHLDELLTRQPDTPPPPPPRRRPRVHHRTTLQPCRLQRGRAPPLTVEPAAQSP